MSLSDELRDPWGYVAAGTLGGLAWAVAGSAAVAVPAGLAVGAAVIAVKAATGALVGRRGGSGRSGAGDAGPARPPRDSVAGRWFTQAEAAVRALDEMARSAPPGATGTAVRSAADGADDALLALGRLGVQVTAVEAALARVELPGLDADAARIAALADRAPNAEIRAEVERSAASLHDRVDVRNRLRATRDTLLARMQSTTFGLESLGARLAEVLAMSAAAGSNDTSARDVAEVAADLDGLRAGLAESEAVSRRALAQTPLEGGPAG